LTLVSSLKSVERGMLDDTLYAELAHFRNEVETARALGAFHSRTTIIHVTPLDTFEDVPDHMLRLPLGLHDVVQDGRNFRVLIEELDGVRYSVQYDDTNILIRERHFTSMVWLSSLAVLILSLLFAWWVSRRLGQPTYNLEQQIRTLGERPNQAIDLSQFQDDEIGQLARRLQQYHEQLTRLVTREREFAGNVSHELRTPVTNVALAAEVLANSSALSTKDRERIERIQRATREMSELVDTFLVLAQIDDESRSEYSACDLGPVVNDVIAQQRVWLGEKPVTVSVLENTSITVVAPIRVLSVLIANLVRNAFRYTNSGTVTVTLDNNTVSVTDTGIGIDMQTQSRLFERNTRGKTGDQDGAGLGLSIVQRICERYGWTASYQSTEGQGSRFCIDFSVNSDSQ